MTRSLQAIEAAVRRLAVVIAAPDSALPTFGASDDNGRPHVEVADRYHYVVRERGKELSRQSTDDEDRLLYWIFEDVTFTMAGIYEMANRVPGQDFRRLMFRRQMELLGALDARWRAWGEARLRDILARHPYVDRAGR